MGKKRARKDGGGGQRDYASLLGLLLLDAETRPAVAEADAEEVELLIVRPPPAGCFACKRLLGPRHE